MAPAPRRAALLVAALLAEGRALVVAGGEDAHGGPLGLEADPEELSTLPLSPGETPWRVLVEGGPALLPSPLEDLGRSAMATALRTQAAASSALSAGGEVFARRDAEEVEDAAVGAEAASSRTAQAKKLLQEALSREERAREGAEHAGDLAEAALQRSSGFVRQLGTNVAGIVASTGMEAELSPLYKGLQEWKMKVLYNPLKAGRVAGAKDALPYEKALLKIEHRVGEANQKATAMSAQARTMRANAASIADFAVNKQAAGQVWAASNDMMKAHQMVDQAKLMEEEAMRIHAGAQVDAEKIPLYVVAARDAAQAAVHRFVPGYAPPPMGKGPFLRPPPTNV